MKKGIHPKIYTEAVVTCVGCNTAYTVPSMVESMQVELCSNCHPFFTGEKRFVDTMGRVEKFEQRQEIAKKAKAVNDQKIEVKKQIEEKKKTAPKTLKEMMNAARTELKK